MVAFLFTDQETDLHNPLRTFATVGMQTAVICKNDCLTVIDHGPRMIEDGTMRD